MSKHTPGPWRFSTEPQPNGCPIVGSKGVMIAMLAHSVHEDKQKETAIANAKLIAAAPDMLAALQLLLTGAAGGGGSLRLIGDAIAKATGK